MDKDKILDVLTDLVSQIRSAVNQGDLSEQDRLKLIEVFLEKLTRNTNDPE